MADFIMAQTPQEAASLKTDRSAFLAGGTEINRLGSFVDADSLVCIGRLNLDGVTLCEDKRPSLGCGHHKEGLGEDSFIRIGATCTFQEAIEDDLVPSYFKDACRYMASRTKRNMATIGGNVALRRDDSYLWAVLLASHAKLEIMLADGSVRWICCNKYNNCHEDFRNCLILAVLLHNDDRKVVSKRYANTAESHSYLTVAACMEEGNLRLAATVKNSGIYVLKRLQEMALNHSEEDIMKQAEQDCQINISDDMFGSASYKRYLLGVTVIDLVKKIS